MRVGEGLYWCFVLLGPGSCVMVRVWMGWGGHTLFSLRWVEVGGEGVNQCAVLPDIGDKYDSAHCVPKIPQDSKQHQCTKVARTQQRALFLAEPC